MSWSDPSGNTVPSNVISTFIVFHSINCFFRYIAFLTTKIVMEAEWLFFNFLCLSKLPAQLSKKMHATKHDVYNGAFNLCQKGMNFKKQSCTSEKQAPEKGDVSPKDNSASRRSTHSISYLTAGMSELLHRCLQIGADRHPLSLQFLPGFLWLMLWGCHFHHVRISTLLWACSDLRDP